MKDIDYSETEGLDNKGVSHLQSFVPSFLLDLSKYVTFAERLILPLHVKGHGPVTRHWTICIVHDLCQVCARCLPVGGNTRQNK